jgi:hypothetical protein
MCGRLEHGFPFALRYLFAAHPQAMGKVSGIVYRAISTHLIHKDCLVSNQRSFSVCLKVLPDFL